MIVMMVVSLFTSRVVLDVLGADDYGINNIIAGVIVLFSFLNQALLSATQRFLNFYLGKDDLQNTRKVFCMSMNVYIILSVVVLIAGETIGLWFVNSQLNIPPDRMYAANWVYQLTLAQFVISLFRVPYNASIIAYEKMDFFAFISLYEVIAKLLVVYLLYVLDFDKLILYAIFYTVIIWSVNIIYRIFCNRKFTTTKYRLYWDKEMFSRLFYFSGWSLFGSLANVATIQGVNILINIFYGVTVNAAAGIANQVNNAINGLVTNFQTAFQPQIVKTYANNETEQMYSLVFRSSKFSYFLILLLVLPLMFTMEGILDIWLVEVPESTTEFCRLIMITLCIEAVAAPMWMLVQAYGKIKEYQILMSFLILLNLPLSYMVLFMGYPAYAVWYVRIVVSLLIVIVRALYVRKRLNFPLSDYCTKVIGPISAVTLFAIPLPFCASRFFTTPFANICSVFVLAIGALSILVYLIGLNKAERSFVNNMIGSVYKKLFK